MKALFIWNNSSKSFLTKSLVQTKQFSDVVENSGIKKGFLVSTKADWLAYKEHIKEVQNIYILVELDWDHNIFKGYEIGLEILKNWTGQNPPTIQFVSMMSRQYLYDNVSGKDQYLVKVFNHINLFNMYEEKLDVGYTSINEWNFYKNYALTRAGILDDFSHRLETITSVKGNIDPLLMLIKQIKGQSNIVGENVIKHISNLQEDEVDIKGFVTELKQLIDERKLIYGSHKSDKLNMSSNFKVMIVEDNDQQLGILKKSLERYFFEDQIKYFSKGEEAIKAYEENPKDYNLIFLDLELLEGDFYQPIQGLHILKKIQDKRVSSFTVITGLGRKGVQELLKIPINKIVSKKQLYQFEADKEVDKEVDNMLKRMVEEFVILEGKKHINFGPNKSYFEWGGFRTILSEFYKDKIYRDKVWKEAHKVVHHFRKHELQLHHWPNESKTLVSPRQRNRADYSEFAENKFSTLLAHRLIIIYLGSLNDFALYLDNEHYSEYVRMLSNSEINLNRGYLGKICLNYIKISAKSEEPLKYEIKKKNMFLQEIAFIRQLEKEKKVSLGNIYLKDNSPDLFNVFSTYLDLEEEQYKALNVRSDASVWTILDTISVVNTLFSDIISKRKKSEWYHTVESLLESPLFTKAIELELESFIPDISNKVDRIHQILD